MSDTRVEVKSLADVTFNPKIRVMFNDSYGSTSFATWDNPDVKKALSAMFNVKENEELTSVEVTDRGISATVRHVPVYNK